MGAPRVTAPSQRIHRCASGGTSWEGRRVGIEDALGMGRPDPCSRGRARRRARRERPRRRRAGSRPGCRFPARAAGRVSLGDGLGADASSVPCRGARPQRAMGAKPGARRPPVSVPDRRRARPRPRGARQGTDLPSAVWRTLPALRPHGRWTALARPRASSPTVCASSDSDRCVPARSGRPDGFAPARPRVLARLRVGTNPALLLRERSYPLTTVHSGHLAIVWNESNAGYTVSGHPSEPRTAQQRRLAVRALRAMAVAMRSQ